VNSPLITGAVDDIILDKLNISSLHIQIGKSLKFCIQSEMYLNFAGVVDKHITCIEKNVFPTHQKGQQFMEDFLKNVNTK
jgi:hypothetical protein